MKKLARITAVILLVVGGLMILCGIGVGFSGIFSSAFAARQFVPGMLGGRGGFPLAGSVTAAGGFLIGLLVLFQGIFTAGFGEALYLLADLSKEKPKIITPIQSESVVVEAVKETPTE